MLPGRGIVRSLPSGGLQRQIASQSASSRTLSRRLGNGRQFGTLKGAGAGLMMAAPSRVGSGRCVAAPVVLGGVSSARNLSVWGYSLSIPGWGKKKTDDAAAAAPEATTTTTTTETPPAPADAVAATATGPEPPSMAPADIPSSVTPSDLDLSAIAELGNPDILNMPEDLGYLHNLGLDYGWGPTSAMQWVLEHVHVYSGLGWGGSIIATAFLLRAIMLYPQIKSMQFGAVMQRVKDDPRSKEALQLVRQGWQTNDREMISKGQFLNKMVREQYGVSNAGMLWSFIQIPFSFGLFRITSGMVHIPVPSLETAGFLWFPDLTASDPYFFLPAAGSALLFGSIMVNSKYAAAQQKDMMKKMMYVMGPVGFFFTSWLSAGVNLMMLSTGTAAFFTAALLNIKPFRQALGLSTNVAVKEVKYQPPRPTSSGVAGIRERLTNNLDEMKKGLSEQMTNYTGKYAGTEEERAEQKRKETLRKLEDMRRQLEREQFEKKYKDGR